MKKLISVILIIATVLSLAAIISSCGKEVIVCKECNKENEKDCKFCIHCGAVIPVESDKDEKACAACGTANPVNGKFCVNCGKEFVTEALPVEKTCSKCNTVNGADSKFCGNCGNPLNGTGSVPNEDTTVSEVDDTTSVQAEPPADDTTSIQVDPPADDTTSSSGADAPEAPDPESVWLVIRSHQGQNSTLVFEYDYDGNQTSMKFCPYNNENQVLIEYTTEYEDGFASSYSNSFSSGYYTHEFVNTAAGQKASKTATYTNDGALVATEYFEYDSNGLLTEKRKYDENGSLTERTEYSKGLEQKRYNGDGTLINEWVYNSKGWLTNEYQYNRDGSPFGMSIKTHDSHGNVVENEFQNSATGEITKTLYEYISLAEYRRQSR